MGLSIAKEIEHLLAESEPYLSATCYAELRALAEKKLGESRLKVLLYGPYNAGKTTLVNALAGEELFPMGSTPTTSVLQKKPFGEYEIVDSPGLGAPDPAAEEAARKAARWDADLVLFVLSSEGSTEDEMVWAEVRDFVSRRKPVLLVVQKKERLGPEDEERIASRLTSRVAAVCEEVAPDDESLISGPVFVNAYSAFQARTARPIKAKLEEESGIMALEARLREAAKERGALLGACSVATALAQSLSEARARMEREMPAMDEVAVRRLAELEGLRGEFEEFVRSQVQERMAALASVARAEVYSEGSVAVFEQMLRNEVWGLCERAEGLLCRRLADLGLTPFPDLFSKVFERWEPGAERQRETCQALADDANGLASDAEKGEHEKAPADGGHTPSLFQTVGVPAEALRKAGYLRTLSIMGKFGKYASKAIRWAPIITIAVDAAIAIYKAIREYQEIERRREQIRKEERRRQKREAAAKRAMEVVLIRQAATTLEAVQDKILIVGLKYLADLREEQQEAVARAAGVSEEARRMLAEVTDIEHAVRALLYLVAKYVRV